ncbi:hypothetical protein MBLNU13_g01854t2 [Cladosporium sp. NU13]
MATTTSKLPIGSLVLVTGANGFVASHVVDRLLEDGFNVRGSVRSEEKGKWLHQVFGGKYGKGRFETVIVPDMQANGAFDAAVKGVAGICHTASIMTFVEKPEEVIPIVVKGATNIVAAALKDPSVKSLVYTSSSTAALLPQPNKRIEVTKDTWNDDSVNAAKGPKPNQWEVYGASKTEAERAVWRIAKESGARFQVSAILPNAMFGPLLKPGGADTSSTATWLLNLFNGDADAFDSFPPQYYVDVRDTACLHSIALRDPSCHGRRLFSFAAPFNRSDVLALFRELRPGKTFPEDDRETGRDLSVIPNEDANELLEKHYGKGFASLKECVEATINSIRKELKTRKGRRFVSPEDPALILLTTVWVLSVTFFGLGSPLKDFPGPPAWPMMGNYLSLYNKRPETVYKAWAQRYGRVFRVQIGFTPALIVNSGEAAKDMFTSNFQDLGSRPQLYTFHKIISSKLGTTVGGSGCDKALERSRKSMAAELSKSTVTSNLANIDRESRISLQDLLTYGNAGKDAIDFYMYITRMSMTLCLTICYDRPTALHDPMADEIIYVKDRILALRSPVMIYLDHGPLLRKIDPKRTHRFAIEIRDRRDAYCLQLNSEVDDKIMSGNHVNCLYTKDFHGENPLPQEELLMVLV